MAGNEMVSDRKYYNLFYKMTRALSYTEIVLDKQGNPCDLRLLDVNPAMEKLMDIPKSGIVGKTCIDLNLLTEPEQESTALLQDIIIAIRFRNSYQSRLFSSSLNKWLEVSLFFICDGYYGLLLTDITEREMAEKALRDSEEKYHTLFNLMDEGLAIFEMIFDTEGKPVDQLFLEMNEAFCKQTEHSVVEGKLTTDLIPNANDYWFETFGQVALTGKSVRFEKKSEVLNRWYEVFAYKIGGQDSRVVATLFKDITESKKHEEKLTFQANLLSCVNDAILATDENEKFIYWNDMAEKIFGWSSQEAIGRTIEELFPRNTSISLMEARANLRQEGSYVGEIEYRRKDGVLINTDTHIKIFVNHRGEFKGEVASIRDITQRKRKEEELKAVKESLAEEIEALTKLHSLSTKLILQDNLQNIYEKILDVAIELTHANKGAISKFDKRTGYIEALKTRGFDYEASFIKHFKYSVGQVASRKAFKERIRVIIEDVSETSFYDEKDRKVLLDEGVKTLQSTPMISSSGDVLGILVTHYTNKHRFEERELRMLDLIAHQAADVIARTEAEEVINQSNKRALALVEELRKMDENKNEFLNMLSHELRNPLASIRMSLSLLERVEPNGEQARQTKEVMKRQTAQLSRLVDDLLDVTRITQNKVSLKKEHVNLNELVSKAVEDYKIQFENQEVRLEVELASGSLCLEADPARLTQVIGNLLHNAAKFTVKGNYTRVKVWKDEEKQEAVISVKDNGLGIRSDLMPDLFLPFIQVDSSLDRSRGGLGLGLVIVKGMVDLHGGSVSAVSEGYGKGSEFIIRLPLPAVNNHKQVKQPQASEKASRSLQILVIDDIPDVADILCSLLRQMGHQVISAYDGKEGIAKAKAFRPDVLLCDIGMPGMNGYEVAKNIRNDNELKSVFLIALTGYAQPNDLKRAKESGFDRHVAKPVDLDILKKALAEIP